MADKQRVSVGVVGAGGISQVAHIPNLIAMPDVELAAITDLDPTRASMVADRFAIPAWYEEPDGMFRNENLDAVVIATPTISHLPLCRVALESGVDVLIEKPFARNAGEARQMVEIAERTGHTLMVGMNHRFREDTTHLMQFIAKGGLGDIYAVRTGWLKRMGVWGRPYWFMDPKLAGGGVLLDLGIQMLDLVLFCLGFPAVLEAHGSTSDVMLDLDVEDNASAFLRLGDNISCHLEVSWANCAPEDVAYTIISGTEGAASLNPLQILKCRGNNPTAHKTPVPDDQVQLYHRSFQAEIAHFMDCVQTGIKPLSTGREALQVLEVVEAIYKSAGH